MPGWVRRWGTLEAPPPQGSTVREARSDEVIGGEDVCGIADSPAGVIVATRRELRRLHDDALIELPPISKRFFARTHSDRRLDALKDVIGQVDPSAGPSLCGLHPHPEGVAVRTDRGTAILTSQGFRLGPGGTRAIAFDGPRWIAASHEGVVLEGRGDEVLGSHSLPQAVSVAFAGPRAAVVLCADLVSDPSSARARWLIDHTLAADCPVPGAELLVPAKDCVLAVGSSVHRLRQDHPPEELFQTAGRPTAASLIAAELWILDGSRLDVFDVGEASHRATVPLAFQASHFLVEPERVLVGGRGGRVDALTRPLAHAPPRVVSSAATVLRARDYLAISDLVPAIIRLADGRGRLGPPAGHAFERIAFARSSLMTIASDDRTLVELPLWAGDQRAWSLEAEAPLALEGVAAGGRHVAVLAREGYDEPQAVFHGTDGVLRPSACGPVFVGDGVMQIDPEGAVLALCLDFEDETGSLTAFDLSTGEVTGRLHAEAYLRLLAVHHGATLAGLDDDGRLWRYGPDLRGAPLDIPLGLRTVSLDRHGRTLAFIRFDRDRDHAAWIDGDDTSVTSIPATDAAAISASTRRLAYATDGVVRCHAPDGTTQLVTPLGACSPVHMSFVGPDASSLVIVGRDGSIALFDER